MSRALNPQQKIYQRQLGLRFGAIFSAIVSFGWMGPFSQYLSGDWQIRLLPVVGVALLLIMIWWDVDMFRVRLPKGSSPSYFSSGKFWGIFYGIIIAESMLIYLLIQLFNSHGLPEAMWPTIAIIVALHWIPLGVINGIKEWWVVAGLICTPVIISLITAAHSGTTTIFGIDANIWGLTSSATMMTVMLFTSLWFQILFANERHRTSA